jgi:hypothetical protein
MPEPAAEGDVPVVHETLLKWVVTACKVLSFLGYAATSVVFLIYVLASPNSYCFIRSTYRQDFLSKLQSDPLYTTTNVFRAGPMSQEGSGTVYKHMQSDIGIFPVMTYNNSYPFLQDAINSLQSLQFVSVKNNDHGIAFDMTANKLAQTMMAQAGSQVDYLRCLSISEGSSLAQLNAKMQDIRGSSRRMGTCLLTGQHAMVDISSNPKTSMVFFSSVNPLFVATVVLWISASFSLFFLGKDFLKYFKNTVIGKRLGDKDSWGGFGISDFVLVVCTVWNLVLAIISLVPFAQDKNVPVNNSAMAVIVIFLTIATQWTYANNPESSDAGALLGGRGTVSQFDGGQRKSPSYFATANFFPAYPKMGKGYVALGGIFAMDKFNSILAVSHFFF